jgi:hypothetical protein
MVNKVLVWLKFLGGQELKKIMTGNGPVMHLNLRKLTGIFAILDKSDWKNRRVNDETIIRKATQMIAASMSRKLADTVMLSLFSVKL